jgi:hypothetical protein
LRNINVLIFDHELLQPPLLPPPVEPQRAAKSSNIRDPQPPLHLTNPQPVIQFQQRSPPLFAALARSPDPPSLEQQEEFMNTATVQDRSVITVDYDKTLQDMIADGNYDWVNPDITAKKFPVEGAAGRSSAPSSSTSTAPSRRKTPWPR